MAESDWTKKGGERSGNSITGEKVLEFFKNPISGIMGANTKKGKEAAEAMNARPQYYGGSQEAADAYRQKYDEGSMQGGLLTQQGLDQGQRSVTDARGQNRYTNMKLGDLATNQGAEAAAAGAGFDRQVGNADMSRAMVLGQGQKLEQMANRAPQEYMRTDQNAFQAQQDQATRGALSIGAGGGASGVRAALAGSQDANAAAAQQAQMVRANEYNALLGNRQQAVGQAAGIYSGVGAQDQSLAQLQSQRQLQATGQQASLYGAQGNLALGTGQLGVSQAGQATTAGLTTQGQYIGAETTANSAELQAAQANEAARQATAKDSYKKKYQPIRSMFGM